MVSPQKKVFATEGCEHLIELESEDQFPECTRSFRVWGSCENDLVQDGLSLCDKSFDFVVGEIRSFQFFVDFQLSVDPHHHCDFCVF
ncbi:hypothetical protein KOR42_38170 [Thalassoglobus neptunius]|uniref:Uncharacterized protein n=1 Tax=Thalassoglobus neptunius TaxID=1938619 RepID=A0A5C5WIE3_9PLAN|nr:hypothetical protein KOR42_38170 [Thalassoglobus neptunius]